MTLADVNRPDVLAAIEEFDRVGREEFLRGGGFGRALSYYLEFEEQLYDSKAVVGYATVWRLGFRFSHKTSPVGRSRLPTGFASLDSW